jgi:hypothetical protein
MVRKSPAMHYTFMNLTLYEEDLKPTYNSTFKKIGLWGSKEEDVPRNS